MNSSPKSETLSTPPGMPGQQVRGIVSLLIIVHLFVVGLAMVTSTDSGASKLLNDIKEFTPGVNPYLTQLWLDHGYDYHLMNDLPLDWDHYLEATIHYADGRQETLVLPDSGLWPSERRDRYARLAWYVDFFVTRAAVPEPSANDVFRKTLLPGAIGAGLIRQHPDANSVALRCYYRRGISRQEMADADPHVRDPNDALYLEKVSDVSVVLTADGRPQTFDNLPPLEVSPLRSRAAIQSDTKQTPESKNPLEVKRFPESKRATESSPTPEPK